MKKQFIQESADQKHIREFIQQVCEGNLAEANASMSAAINEKLKAKIRTTLKEIK